jgi:hypothetical protein
MKARFERRFTVAALLAAALVSGCASLGEHITDSRLKDYFRDAGPAPAEVRHELGALPFSEYWTGIVFNGAKIGFAHLAVRPAAGVAPRYDVASEASFVLRFLGTEKQVRLKAHDEVREDLSLARFAYDYVIDGSAMRITGRTEPGELVATVVTGGEPVEQRLAVKGRIFPQSVIALYPVVHGLAVGREYAYRVYSGELQAVADVSQRVEAYEASTLFEGETYKVSTRMSSERVLTWIDRGGRPVFELSLNGAMISALEDAAAARRDVALAALNKSESLIEFSIVRPDSPIRDPRAVSAMKVALANVDDPPPSGAGQRCTRASGEIVCEIRRAAADVLPASGAPPDAKDLSPSVTVQSNSPLIRRIAQEITAGAASDAERIARIVKWLDANVEKAPLDVFSALDVLDQRKAECQGHSYLYAALARAAGVPTRVVNGVVYSEDFGGFLFHTWAESDAGGRWQAVDPTFGEVSADATHLKLLEGETLAELAPLLGLVGKLRIRVLAVEHRVGSE